MLVAVKLLNCCTIALVTQLFSNFACTTVKLQCTRVEQIGALNRTSSFVLIGFLQILNSIPSKYRVSGVVLSQAMKFAVKEANQNLLPPNVQFSYRIYDNCGEENLQISAEIVLRLILNDPWENDYNVTNINDSSTNNVCRCSHQDEHVNVPVGIIGPPTSTSSKYVGELLSFLDIPMISYLATSTELNDRQLYQNIFRTIPTDNLISKVILDIVKEYNWTYVSILSADNSYGRNGRHELLHSFKHNNICTDIDELVSIPHNKSQVRDVVQKLKRWRMTQVVIFFALEDTVEQFFRVATEEKLHGITWIFPGIGEFGQWYLNIDINMIKGAIGVVHFTGEYKAFAEYFWNLSAEHHAEHDLFLKDFFGKHTNVTNLSDMKETLKTTMNYAGYVRNAVFSYVHAFRNYLQENTECLSKPWEICAISHYNRALFVDKYLKKVTFKGLVNETVSFDQFGVVEESMFQVLNIRVFDNGESKVDTIGSWSSTHKLSITMSPHWTSENQQRPYSQCSEECRPGKYAIVQSDKSCCWVCVLCKEGTYKNTYGNHECKVCPDGKSTGNRTTCVTMTIIGPVTLVWNKYILVPVCVFGCILSLMYLVTWLTFRSTPIVKSSNVRLSVMQISVQMLLFLTIAPTFSIELSTVLCVSRMIVVGTEIVVTISLLTIKCQQLLRVFHSKVKITKQHIFVTNSVGYAMLFLTIFIELTIAGGIILTQDARIGVKYYDEDLTKERHCIVPYIVPAQVLYITVLSTICCIQAFRSRNLPSKFNEARCIFHSVFAMFVIISTMMILWMNSRTSTDGDFFLSTGIALSNLSILVVMYGQKTWNLWFNKSKYTVETYRQSVFDNVVDCANRKIYIVT